MKGTKSKPQDTTKNDTYLYPCAINAWERGTHLAIDKPAYTTKKSTPLLDKIMFEQIEKFEKSFIKKDHVSEGSLGHNGKIHSILERVRANPDQYEIWNGETHDDFSVQCWPNIGEDAPDSVLATVLESVAKNPGKFEIWENNEDEGFAVQIWAGEEETTSLRYSTQISNDSGFTDTPLSSRSSSLSDITLVPRNDPPYSLTEYCDHHSWCDDGAREGCQAETLIDDTTQPRVTASYSEYNNRPSEQSQSQGVFSSCTPFLNSYGMSAGKAIAATALVGIGIWASCKAYNFLTGNCP